MSAWATVVLTLGASAIAVLGALAATRLQHHYARQERREAQAAALRQQGAAIVGPIATLLADAEPTRLAINASPQMLEMLGTLRDRWQTLRDELAAYASGHPMPGLAVTAQRLTVAVSNALTSGAWVVSDLVEGAGDRQRTRDAAKSDHARALELLDLLRAGIRGEATDRELAGKTVEIDARADAIHEAITER